jgi:hypothetical protein
MDIWAWARSAALCAALTTLLAGCSVTRPVAVIGAKGQVPRGTVTASMSGGSPFSVTDGKLTCAGSYDAWDVSQTIAMAVQCNDGRNGIITATRQRDGLNGSGRVRLNDGMEADFVFGDAAAAS